MAVSVDYSGAVLRIVVPQADLTLISGSLYELDTDWFFDQVKALEAATNGIVFQNAIDHNPEYTIAGVTYARKIEIMNSTNTNPVFGAPNTDEYEVFFSPDTTYSVRLAGSNNNIFDIQNAILANTVTQVIPQNSAGLIVVSSGSGLSAAQATQLVEIYTRLGLNVADSITDTPTGIDSASGDIDINRTGDGVNTSTLTRQP